MAVQDFNIQSKDLKWKKSAALLLSIPLVALVPVILLANPGKVFHSLSLALSLSAAITACNYLIYNYVTSHSKIKGLTNRAILHAGLVFTLATALSLVFTGFWQGLLQMPYAEIVKFSALAAIMSLAANAGFSAINYMKTWRDNLLHTEELKREIMHLQLDGMRQQLSPHFFFNSLNSLSLVIQEDPAEAVKYVHHIAHMYRYLLQNNDTKVVPLRHELRFAESYIYLQKMRFGNALDMTIDISKAELQTVIPPLTLYILLENALKHNIITKAKPLHIHVFIKEGKLQISNNIQSRNLPDENPVIGLRTIRSSYESVSVQPMQIIQDDTNFTVALPLLKELSQTA